MYQLIYLDIMSEPLVEAICVSTLIIKSLQVNWVYRGRSITFMGRYKNTDLIVLDMVGFDVILGVDWLSSHHTILDCHAKK